MKKTRLERNHSLRFLTVRAIITILLVLAVLMGLKKTGVTVVEHDVPIPVVEDIAREAGAPAESTLGQT